MNSKGKSTMSNWIGTWDVKQKTIVGTLPMDMVVSEEAGGYAVRFESEKVVAEITGVTVDGDSIRIETDLKKPMKAHAVMELSLTGPDSLEGVGKIKFMPNSTFTGVRKALAS